MQSTCCSHEITKKEHDVRLDYHRISLPIPTFVPTTFRMTTGTTPRKRAEAWSLARTSRTPLITSLWALSLFSTLLILALKPAPIDNRKPTGNSLGACGTCVSSLIRLPVAEDIAVEDHRLNWVHALSLRDAGFLVESARSVHQDKIIINREILASNLAALWSMV